LTVTVRYYAKLKEQAGTAQEEFATSASTVGALWTEAAARHGFTLERGLVKAAQADEFCSWEAALVPGATVVFMPPVAGG
jgi:molybdopterin converting factor small subunit